MGVKPALRSLIVGCAVGAVLFATCGADGTRAGQQPLVSEPSTTSDRSPVPVAEAVARLQTIVRGMASAALPVGPWTEELADSNGGPATDVCDDAEGNATEYRVGPFAMVGPFDSGADPAENKALLDRVETYLTAQGYSAARATPVGSAGRVSGSRDGFFVALTIPANAMQIVAEGTTPCVR